MTKSPVFSAPPVDEVALGLTFEAPSNINYLDLAKLWEKFIAIGFDEIQTHPPIPTRGSRVLQNFNLELKMAPDLPRFWFIKNTKEYIVQIQENKFVLNWRISDEPTRKYVGFATVQQCFWEYVELFQLWFEQHAGKALRAKGLELTYYNTIPIEGGFTSATLSGIYKDFQWSPKSTLSNSVAQMFFEVILPVEEINAQMFILGHTGKKIACDEEIHRLELAVVGKTDLEFKKELINAWYSEAHDKIVHGFVELTTPEMHNRWGLNK